jgi:hypothetical protein
VRIRCINFIKNNSTRMRRMRNRPKNSFVYGRYCHSGIIPNPARVRPPLFLIMWGQIVRMEGWLTCVLGWYLDEIIGYIVRSIIRFVKVRQSAGWPVGTGTVSSSRTKYGPGGHVAEVIYAYTHQGEYYGGTYRRPFFFGSSAEHYLQRFTPESSIEIRIKPGQPEISFVHDDD